MTALHIKAKFIGFSTKTKYDESSAKQASYRGLQEDSNLSVITQVGSHKLLMTIIYGL